MYGLKTGKEAVDTALLLAGMLFLILLTGVIAAAAAGVGIDGASTAAAPSVEGLLIVGLILVNDSAASRSLGVVVEVAVAVAFTGGAVVTLLLVPMPVLLNLCLLFRLDRTETGRVRTGAISRRPSAGDLISN